MEKVHELSLPNTVVARIIKEALPDGISVGKEARAAISRAASVFVMYLTSSTAVAAKKQNHKTLSPNNVFEALEEIEFESFIDTLQQSLATYRAAVKEKKESKTPKLVTGDDVVPNDVNNEIGDGTEVEE